MPLLSLQDTIMFGSRNPLVCSTVFHDFVKKISDSPTSHCPVKETGVNSFVVNLVMVLLE
jgi:hypothetical protein